MCSENKLTLETPSQIESVDPQTPQLHRPWATARTGWWLFRKMAVRHGGPNVCECQMSEHVRTGDRDSTAMDLEGGNVQKKLNP